MKKDFIWCGILVLILGIGCKKNVPGNQPLAEKKWLVTTVAGDGTADFADGPVLFAKFNHPTDVVITADGTIFVTDADNRRIRKISGGQVSTFAGSGDSGIVNGAGASARFIYPYSIALDANGNLYTSDQYDEHIRKITPGADVTNLPAFTHDDFGLFIAVQGIAPDAQGNVFVADTYNQRVRKINTSGLVTTIAGNDSAGFRNGSGTTALLNYPSGIAIDKEGNLYVPDQYNYCIRKITAAGQVSTFSGSGKFGHVDGDATQAQFNFPTDIVIDGEGNLYVADYVYIRKISPQGAVSTIAGNGYNGFADGAGTMSEFSVPTGLGIDSHGNIYVADFGNNCIRKLSFE